MFYIKGSKLERGTLIRFEEDIYGKAEAGQIGMVIDHHLRDVMHVLIGEKLVDLWFSHVSLTGWISEITVIK